MRKVRVVESRICRGSGGFGLGGGRFVGFGLPLGCGVLLGFGLPVDLGLEVSRSAGLVWLVVWVVANSPVARERPP